MTAENQPKTPLPTVAGHDFELLTEGPERLEALVALIDEARRSVKLLFYIFLEDETSVRVRDALLRARERGVEVALLIDGFGSSGAPESLFAPLERLGCSFCRFQPRRGRRYLIRNHQKIAIADDERALLGGFNVERGYFARPGEAGGWRDLGMSVQGPVVASISAYFDAIMHWSSDPRGEIEELRALLHEHNQLDGDVRLLLGGPTRELSPWAQMLRNDLFSATRIDMVAAYFAPYSAFLYPIRRAARRGHARLVAAAKSDNGVTIAAARNRFQYLLPETEIYEYRPMMLHTKLYVADDAVYIGSANCDVRSLYLNLEVMLRVHDTAFADAIRAYVDGEIAESRRITAESYARERTLWTRFKGRLAYLTMSVLDYNVSRRLNFGLDGR